MAVTGQQGRECFVSFSGKMVSVDDSRVATRFLIPAEGQREVVGQKDSPARNGASSGTDSICTENQSASPLVFRSDPHRPQNA